MGAQYFFFLYFPLYLKKNSKISEIEQPSWCGDDLEFAGPSDDIPNPPVFVGMTYNVRFIHCCSPSDFVVRNWDRAEEYGQLKGELDVIYQGQPTWLRIRVEDIHTMTPIAYLDSDHQTGRGYIIVHETNPELMVFDVDEGLFQEVNIENVFYLAKDHASIPAFAIRGETAFGDGISRGDGWSLLCCLVFTGKAIQKRGNPIIYSHMESE